MKWMIVICMSVVLISCRSQSVQIPKDIKGFKKLSEYQLFEGELSKLQPVSGVTPYDLNTPLFSDYALKKRFIWVPEGLQSKVLEDGSIDFPIGTILVKNFYYEENDIEKILETRLLIHYKEGWQAYPYIWNKEQTEAFLEVAGGDIPMTIQHAEKSIGFKYSVPNKNQCKSCHNLDNKIVPIGPKISNLNKAYPYVEGSKNQLDHWSSKGVLDFQRENSTPVMANWEDPSQDITLRAKAYLEVNCGHCHHPKGPANTSGLFLQSVITNPSQWGICKTPVAAGRGSGGRKVAIHPGEPDASILLYRMESNDPGIMMPELGRKLIHQEAVELIRAWIESMEKQDCYSSNSVTTTSSSSTL